MTFNVTSGTLNPTIPIPIPIRLDRNFNEFLEEELIYFLFNLSFLKHFHFLLSLHLSNNCLSNAFDRLSDYFGFCLCVCICPQIRCRTITSAILYRFLPNFTCYWEIWLFRRLVVNETGNRIRILERCKFRFRY